MWEIEDFSNEFDDDRLEPTLLSLALLEQEVDKQGNIERSKVGLALGVSALLHCIVFALLLSARIDPPPLAPQNNVSVRLQLVPALIPAPQPTTDLGAAVAPTPPEVTVAEIPVNIPTVDFSAPLPKQTVEAPETLTTLQLRSIVQENRYAQESNSLHVVCTPQQERSELFDCPNNSDTRDYDLPENPTVVFFSRDSRASALREQRSTTMRQIAGRLSDTELANSEIESFLKAIDIDRQDLNTSGNARTSNLRDQILMKDATEQLKKRVLNP